MRVRGNSLTRTPGVDPALLVASLGSTPTDESVLIREMACPSEYKRCVKIPRVYRILPPLRKGLCCISKTLNRPSGWTFNKTERKEKEDCSKKHF